MLLPLSRATKMKAAPPPMISRRRTSITGIRPLFSGFGLTAAGLALSVFSGEGPLAGGVWETGFGSWASGVGAAGIFRAAGMDGGTGGGGGVACFGGAGGGMGADFSFAGIESCTGGGGGLGVAALPMGAGSAWTGGFVASGPGEVMTPEQCGQGPVVGGRSIGMIMVPRQCSQRKALLSFGISEIAINEPLWNFEV